MSGCPQGWGQLIRMGAAGAISKTWGPGHLFRAGKRPGGQTGAGGHEEHQHDAWLQSYTRRTFVRVRHFDVPLTGDGTGHNSGDDEDSP